MKFFPQSLFRGFLSKALKIRWKMDLKIIPLRALLLRFILACDGEV